MAGYNSQNYGFNNPCQGRDGQGQNVEQMMAGLKDHTAAYRMPIPTLSSGSYTSQNTQNPPAGYQAPYQSPPNVQFPYNPASPQHMPYNRGMPQQPPQQQSQGNLRGHSYTYGTSGHPYPPHANYGNQHALDQSRSLPAPNSPSSPQSMPLQKFHSVQIPAPPQGAIVGRQMAVTSPSTGERGLKARAQVFSAGGLSFYPSAPTMDAPFNRAVVLLQGLHDTEEHLLRSCLYRMGFDEPNIHLVHEREGIISELEAKRHIAPIVHGLTPGSNLLLIICAYTYEGIELKQDFLTVNIYRHVAQFNKRMRERRMSDVRMPNQDAAESNHSAPVSLHVVLDNVKGSILPYALKFESETKIRSFGLKSVWKSVPRPEKDDKEFREKMEIGRIVQFCSDSTRCGHKPGAMLSAFVCVNLEEAYLPYNVLTYRILDLLNHQFDTYAPRFESTDRDVGARAFGEEFVLLSVQAMLSMYIDYRKNMSMKRAKEARDRMLARGEVLLSSASQFDPNLCADFNWRDETIPLSAELSALSQCI